MPIKTIGGFGAVTAAMIIAAPASAHPGQAAHQQIMQQPIGGKLNNHWYDYRSDVAEAENELRKDLRRAKKESDRREAYAEYNRELFDARKDYRQEMIEQGYVRRGEVIVEPD